MLNPDLQSDLRSDHSRNTTFEVRQAALKLAHKARYQQELNENYLMAWVSSSAF